MSQQTRVTSAKKRRELRNMHISNTLIASAAFIWLYKFRNGRGRWKPRCSALGVQSPFCELVIIYIYIIWNAIYMRKIGEIGVDKDMRSYEYRTRSARTQSPMADDNGKRECTPCSQCGFIFAVSADAQREIVVVDEQTNWHYCHASARSPVVAVSASRVFHWKVRWYRVRVRPQCVRMGGWRNRPVAACRILVPSYTI